jgi:hypothetical protein
MNESRKKKMEYEKEKRSDDAINQIIRDIVRDLGTSSYAWRRVQRALKKGEGAREAVTMSMDQLQKRFVRNGGVICDFEKKKEVAVEKVEIVIPDEIEEWRQECRKREDLNRITQADPRGDEWDHFFRQTKFGSPIRTFALPKAGETVTVKVYEQDGAEVNAIGDGRFFLEQQTQMLQAVKCTKVMHPQANALPCPHTYGMALSVSVAYSRDFVKFAPRGGAQRHERQNLQSLPFKFCTLHLPHSAADPKDITLLRTDDIEPDMHSSWMVVDPAHFAAGHNEVLVNTKTTGSFCLAQRHGTDQVFALAAFVSSLGNTLIGKSNPFSVAVSFNHKRHLNNHLLSQFIQKYEALQPGKKQYWPGKVPVGQLNHVKTEIGGSIRIWPRQSVKTVLAHTIPFAMMEPQVDDDKPTESKFRVGGGILLRATRMDMTELTRGTVIDVWQQVM